MTRVLYPVIAALLIHLASAQTADAQISSRPVVRIVTAGAPGASSDIISRLVADELGRVNPDNAYIVENKTGGGTRIATQYVARAEPNGRTLLTQSNSISMIAALYKNLTFDVDKDFIPVGSIATVPNVLVVSNELPVKTLAEYITYAKANPGKLRYAGIGGGSVTHLLGLLLHQAVKAEVIYIHYPVYGQQQLDMLAGRVDVSLGLLSNELEMIRTGKVRALAVTGAKRSPYIPDVPTFGELGVADLVDANYWIGLFAPVGTPSDIVSKLNSQLADMAGKPELVDKLKVFAMEPVVGSQADFRKIVQDDIVRWQKVAKENNIALD